MTHAIHVKVCGLTSAGDADAANACGADYLGFILDPESPRHVSLEQFQAMAGRLPNRPKVAVAVEPGSDDLRAMRDAGFDRFQVHFRHDFPTRKIGSWVREVRAENLWLAPKLPPGVDVPEAWTEFSECILLDTFDAKLYGGTGRTGDWPKFRRHRERYPGKTWILSGGLNPGNVGGALAQTGATFVDVNSGVESAPGEKDRGKLAAFFAALEKAAVR